MAATTANLTVSKNSLETAPNSENWQKFLDKIGTLSDLGRYLAYNIVKDNVNPDDNRRRANEIIALSKEAGKLYNELTKEEKAYWQALDIHAGT